MKRRSLILPVTVIVIACCLGLWAGQTAEVKKVDKRFLEITSLEAAADVVENGIKGIRVKLQARMNNGETGTTPVIGVHLVDSRGDRVRAAVEDSVYNLDGRVGTQRPSLILEWPIEIFIPYYAVDLPSGPHRLTAVVSAQLRRSFSDTVPLACHGILQAELECQKPPVQKFKLMVRELRVEDRNLKDNTWDNGSIKSRLPDLCYKILLGGKTNTDIIFRSTVVKNSLSAGWIDYSPPVTVSEGDIVTLLVCDRDSMFDDPIGRLKRSLTDLLVFSEEKQKIHFGLVHTCLFDIQVLQ